MKRERLQKYLAACGVGSRRYCEELIARGRVSVNGTTASIGQSVGDGDRVVVNGRPVKPAPERVVIMVNKPKGYLSACHRGHEEGYLVTELVDLPVRLFPVGRLDRESEGLLLLTNDGDLTLRLTHPRYEVEKEYEVELEHVISPEALARLRQGVELEDGPAKPRQVKRLGARRLRIVMAEGRKREVRRMLAAVRLDVVRLVRVRVAGLELGGLESGKWRRVTDEELEHLSAQGLQVGEKG